MENLLLTMNNLNILKINGFHFFFSFFKHGFFFYNSENKAPGSFQSASGLQMKNTHFGIKLREHQGSFDSEP